MACKIAHEAIITIDGRSLTFGQAMSLRVALNTFLLDIAEHKDNTFSLYNDRVQEILALIHSSIKRQDEEGKRVFKNDE